MCYAMICMATDYDCWRQEEAGVTVSDVVANLSANAVTAATLLKVLVPTIEARLKEGLACVDAMNGPCLCAFTSSAKRNPETVEKLRYILDI